MIGRVAEIEQQWAIIHIISVNDQYVSVGYEGMLKREHMGTTNVDKIRVEQCVSPGDIIISKIKSLSETKKILLSIEEEELGVIVSKDEDNKLLIPLN